MGYSASSVLSVVVHKFSMIFAGRCSLVPTASFAKRLAQVAFIFAAVLLTTAAADPAARFNDLGHRLMCSCGCNQILLECTHVGCPLSDGMRHQFQAGINKGDNDSLIFQAFVQRYGQQCLPPRRGKASIGSPGSCHLACFILGIGGTILIVRKWRLRTVPMPPAATTPHFDEFATAFAGRPNCDHHSLRSPAAWRVRLRLLA